MMINDDEYPYIIEHLIEIGALELIGFDEPTQQFTYALTEKAEELVPELYEEHFKFMNDMAFKLWKDGLVDINFDTDGIPMLRLMKKAVLIKDTLPYDQRFFIESMMRKHLEG